MESREGEVRRGNGEGVRGEFGEEERGKLGGERFDFIVLFYGEGGRSKGEGERSKGEVKRREGKVKRENGNGKE